MRVGRGATTGILVVLILLASSFFVPGRVSVAAAPPPVLSSKDLARLYRGEIVFKNQLPSTEGAPRGNGGTAVVLLRADAEEVWRILTDFSHYAGVFPRLKESEPLDRDGPRTLVRFRVGVGPFSFRFFVVHVVSWEKRQIRWYLDRSQTNDLFRDTWGYWRLDPIPGGRVVVTYAMASRTVLPAFLTRGSERESVVKTVGALKARVEAVGKDLGARSRTEPLLRLVENLPRIEKRRGSDAVGAIDNSMAADVMNPHTTPTTTTSRLTPASIAANNPRPRIQLLRT